MTSFGKHAYRKCFAQLTVKMDTLKREDLNANFTAVKETFVTEHCFKRVPSLHTAAEPAVRAAVKI